MISSGSILIMGLLWLFYGQIPTNSEIYSFKVVLKDVEFMYLKDRYNGSDPINKAVTVHGKLSTAADNSISYGKCGFESISEGVYCNLTLETPKHFKKTCSNIYIAGKNDETIIKPLTQLNYFKLQRVNDSTLALFYLYPTPDRQYYYDTFKLVNMDTCAINDFIFSSLESRYGSYTDRRFIFFPDTVVLFLNSKNYENATKMIKLTHEGKEISQVQIYNIYQYDKVFPLDEMSPDKGYFVNKNTKYIEYEYPTVYIDAVGKGHEIIKPQFMPIFEYQTFSTDKNQDLFSYCYIPDSTIILECANRVQCYQCNKETMLLNVTLNLEKNITWVSTYNLGAGKLLIADGYCKPHNVNENVPCDHFTIRKVSSNGEKYPPLKSFKLNINCDVFFTDTIESIIYENAKGEVCFSFWCLDMETNLIERKQSFTDSYQKLCVKKEELLEIFEKS